MFYAMDRYASYKQDWGEFYESGGLIVADRYTTSNAVHQASKLPEAERRAYLDWLFDTEYRLLGLPRPDLVIYLDMPTEITERMMRRREQATGTHADIHERDEAYLKSCRAAAREIVRDCGWTVISCAEGEAPRTPEDIHAQVYQTVKKQLL
jgi:dTMP kinase